MPRWVNIPNLFTLLRLILVPFVVEAILVGEHGRALLLFAGAALTDALDGAAARYLGRTTQAGAYLDPIADKFLLSGVFLALAVKDLIPRWLVWIVFGRDIYILAAVGLLLWFTSVRKFPPSVWGKVSTLFQVLTAVLWMIRNWVSEPVLNVFSSAMIWPCAFFTVWSGIHYTWRGVQMARAH
jgi:cardiolipin synthase (CMP-forming)